MSGGPSFVLQEGFIPSKMNETGRNQFKNIPYHPIHLVYIPKICRMKIAILQK